MQTENTEKMRAFRIVQAESKHRSGFEIVDRRKLTKDDVLIRVHYSAVNYKDALAATGRAPILRVPHVIGGIDASGVVVSSEVAEFKPGDKVVVTGAGLSEVRDGGFADYLYAPADAVVRIPLSWSVRDAAIIGTAGFTAGLALRRLQHCGQNPDQGVLLVTGASGGVGSMSVLLASKLGYSVQALTARKGSICTWLSELGADGFVDPEVISTLNRPLSSVRWGGAIDTLGGRVLQSVLSAIAMNGHVAAIGLANGTELDTTVMPFILRGVSLIGIDSVHCSALQRRETWSWLASMLTPEDLDKLVTQTVDFDDMPSVFPKLLDRKLYGRTLVKILNHAD